MRDFLYDEFPDKDEGEMNRLLPHLVSNEALGRIGLNLQLGSYVRMSRAEAFADGATRPYINACAFEALIGAIYKDQGLGTTRLYVDHLVLRRVREILRKEDIRHPKEMLQEEAQRLWNVTPTYRVISHTGTDHRPHFLVEVLAKKRVLGVGSGENRKQAETQAANNAFKLHFGSQAE